MIKKALYFSVVLCIMAVEAIAENPSCVWIDRTLPYGLSREDFYSLNEEFGKLPETLKKPTRIMTSYNVGDQDVFWTESRGSWQQITAECRKVTDISYIFVALEDGYGNPVYFNGSNTGYITDTDVDQIAVEFNSIHTTDCQIFGEDPPAGIDGEYCVTILLLDIDDSFSSGYTGGVYTAGYFYGVDTWKEQYAISNNLHSNEKKIIYIDTYPLIEHSITPDTNHTVSIVYGTLAHEFQHLIHNYHDPDEHYWVNEGCSGLAEYVCGYGLRSPSHFSREIFGMNSLTQWEQKLSDYEQVALFFLYLYEQYGGSAAIKDIVNNQYNSITGIDSVLNTRGYSERFDDIFDDWILANYLADTSIYNGKYGYIGIDLSGFAFASTYSHSSYPASGNGSVYPYAVEYSDFTYGVPLKMLYSSSAGLEGYIISQGTETTISPISDLGVEFPHFGDTVSGLVLVAPAHETQNFYTYLTSDEVTLNDPYEPNNTAETAVPICFIDSSWSSSGTVIATIDDEDWFSFNAHKGDRVTIICEVITDLDVKLVLYYSDSLLVSSDEIQSSGDETITDFTLPAAGSFYVGVGNSETIGKISRIKSHTGSYLLSVTVTIAEIDPYESNDSKLIAFPISFDGSIWSSEGATITTIDDEDWFTFNARENDIVSITCEVTSGLDAELVFYHDSTLLASSDGHYGGGDEVIAGFSLPETGSYYVGVGYWNTIGKIAEVDDQCGTYTLTVTRTIFIEPPGNVVVTDVPDDQGYSIRLTWTLSPSEFEGGVTWYRIYRSRSENLTTPVALNQFDNVDSLISWDENYTVLIDSVSAGTGDYTDDAVPLTGEIYYYWLQAVGTGRVSEKISANTRIPLIAENVPTTFRLEPPYPNPFNPFTTFRYYLPTACHIELIIYDILGRKVAIVQDDLIGAGIHEAAWNGITRNGNLASSGVYLYRLVSDNDAWQGKMLLIR